MPALKLPQLGVVNSVMRTSPIETGFHGAASGVKFAMRKRLDGGFTIAHRHLSVADIVPDSFPQFFDFLPALRLEWNGIRLRLGKRFIEEARLPRTLGAGPAKPVRDDSRPRTRSR